MFHNLLHNETIVSLNSLGKVCEFHMVREIQKEEMFQLLELYTYLKDNPIPECSQDLLQLWQQIVHDNNHHIIVAVEDDKLVSSCICVVIPNLTHSQRPYALIENVVTKEAYRNRGFATACLNYAKEIAKKENCYKLMLLTGSKQGSTLRFYEQAGYNQKDKTAFIQWLP